MNTDRMVSGMRAPRVVTPSATERVIDEILQGIVRPLLRLPVRILAQERGLVPEQEPQEDLGDDAPTHGAQPGAC